MHRVGGEPLLISDATAIHRQTTVRHWLFVLWAGEWSRRLARCSAPRMSAHDRRAPPGRTRNAGQRQGRSLPGGLEGRLRAVEEVAAVGHDPDKAEESSKRDEKPLRPAGDERGQQKDEKHRHDARHDGYPGCLDHALRSERVGGHVPHASGGSGAAPRSGSRTVSGTRCLGRWAPGRTAGVESGGAENVPAVARTSTDRPGVPLGRDGVGT